MIQFQTVEVFFLLQQDISKFLGLMQMICLEQLPTETLSFLEIQLFELCESRDQEKDCVELNSTVD